VTEITKVKNLLKSLQDEGYINISNPNINKMKSGTTDGNVYIVLEDNTAKYVLKQDQPKLINLTENFLIDYQHVSLLPRVYYTDPDKNFILYSYITGTTHYNRGPKLNWMTTLVNEFFIHYEKCEEVIKWGRLGGIPRESWSEFNKSSIESARVDIGDFLDTDDYLNVKSIVERIALYERSEYKYFLHGDTGVHNFVFNNNTIKGVIDPSPLIGPIIYDFTYAFCSSPDDLNLETLFSSFSPLKQVIHIDKQRLIEEVILQLYTRIGVCVKVHPHDLADYLNAWEYWKKLIPSDIL